MRVGVVGGGLAASLLAWRLRDEPDVQLTLVTGPPTADATGCSGGLVRRFERDAHNAGLAARGLAELRDSATLSEWAGFRQTGSLYLLDGPVPEHAVAMGSTAAPAAPVEVLDAGQVASRFGLRGLPPTCSAVWEPDAGHLDPDRLRRRVLADLAGRGTQVVDVALGRLRSDPGGTSLVVNGTRLATDLIVVAAGAWTGRVLAGIGTPDTGTPDTGIRTKAIQYGVYTVDGERPPAFIDECGGLYGRPHGSDSMLLGLPTDRWDLDPDRPRFSAALERAVHAAAGELLPRLRLGRLVRRVASADAYTVDGRLRLRQVPGGQRPLFTFTGGSGGAAKTALAASAAAAAELLAYRAENAETFAA